MSTILHHNMCGLDRYFLNDPKFMIRFFCILSCFSLDRGTPRRDRIHLTVHFPMLTMIMGGTLFGIVCPLEKYFLLNVVGILPGHVQ